MRVDVRFKSVDNSASLTSYVEEKFAKIAKYEIRPSLVHVTFTKHRHSCQVDVYIKGFHVPCRASAKGDSFYEAVDIALDKVKRQMEREKSRIKRHKWSEAA